MNDEEEVLDLINSNDQVIGIIKRKNAPNLIQTKAGYIRGAVAFIQNDQGQLWIPRRTANKKIAPNGLDFSASEHVSSGENYLDAIVRGFAEELNLKIDPSDIQKIGKLDPLPIAPYFYTEIFLYKSNDSPKYNTNDFVSYEWMTPSMIIDRIHKGDIAKDALVPALQYL